MRLSHPWRIEFGAESYDEQCRESFDSIHSQAKYLETRRIDPLHILEDHQHRLCLANLASGAVRASNVFCLRSCGASSSAGKRPSFGSESISAKSAASCDGCRGLCEHRLELVQLRLRFVLVRQSSGAFQLADDRIKRAVRVLRGTKVAQARVRLGGEVFKQRGREPRFPDTRFAGNEHDLAFARFCPGPAPKKQFEFFFPPDERAQTSRVQCVEATFDATGP